ncbi:MAG TPA: preprotein translocase subunit SecG [Alphaproteobacteria bacterium]|nr:preprotein translocase subunit SecG [Alphaproteobacteria bacterium]
MFSILLVLLIIVSVFMIGLILLQKSEGSGMSGSSAASMFGGVLTGASAGNFLTKTTAWLATIFFVLCAMLAIVASKSDISSRQSELRHELMQREPAQSAPVQEPVPEQPLPTPVSAN